MCLLRLLLPPAPGIKNSAIQEENNRKIHTEEIDNNLNKLRRHPIFNVFKIKKLEKEKTDIIDKTRLLNSSNDSIINKLKLDITLLQNKLLYIENMIKITKDRIDIFEVDKLRIEKSIAEKFGTTNIEEATEIVKQSKDFDKSYDVSIVFKINELEYSINSIKKDIEEKENELKEILYRKSKISIAL